MKASPARVSLEGVDVPDIDVAPELQKVTIRINEISNINILTDGTFMGCNGIGPDFNLSVGFWSSL